MQLNAADDSFNVTGDEKDRPPFDCRERSSPPLFGAILCERGKEADRSAGIYGIDEELTKRAHVAIAHRWNQSFDHGRVLPPMIAPGCGIRNRTGDIDNGARKKSVG